MNMYDIYTHKKTGHVVGIKSGFRWMAFLSPPYWAWTLGLTKLGWIHFLVLILLGWTGIVLIGQMIFEGIKAAEHLGTELIMNDYEKKGQVGGVNEYEAANKYIADNAKPAN